jgi:hypothetical protein
MTVYLDADCALKALVDINIIKPEDWKRENSENYTAVFYNARTRGTYSFAISVENHIHRVSAIYIKNIEKQYRIDLATIVNRCLIP